jgi:hypothetical protein
MPTNIYGGESQDGHLSNEDLQILVGVIVIVLFVAMGMDAPPDISFLIGNLWHPNAGMI